MVSVAAAAVPRPPAIIAGISPAATIFPRIDSPCSSPEAAVEHAARSRVNTVAIPYLHEFSVIFPDFGAIDRVRLAGICGVGSSSSTVGAREPVAASADPVPVPAGQGGISGAAAARPRRRFAAPAARRAGRRMLPLPLPPPRLTNTFMTAIADRPTALVASPTEAGLAAEALLRERYHFVPREGAEQIVALGGDGFLLQTMHEMLAAGRLLPVFGMNRGTVGFLMNEWRLDGLEERLNRARAFTVAPLAMEAETVEGKTVRHPAINEVSLLRETRQAAWIEISVNGRVVLGQLICDGVLVATPAGSTAYNLSAQGPILPLGSNLMALTPISPFRPRRWRGALIPDDLTVLLRVLDPMKRPVSAVADQHEVRDVSTVRICIDRSLGITLLFDPEHALDERITLEQFAT
jgi:NAD+ kinase